ncbi:MAG TPA: hypothetical protein PKX07_11095, partial [Aggregatilineales bacterium]|nr:hypothetical protein [Aggregatilineales bacterium]
MGCLALLSAIFAIPVIGQENTPANACPLILDQSLITLGEACGDSPSGTVCLGSPRAVAAILRDDLPPLNASGSILDLEDLKVVRTLGLDTAADPDAEPQTFGTALLRLSAALPLALDDSINLVLTGDVTLENDAVDDRLLMPVEPQPILTVTRATLYSLPDTESLAVAPIAAGTGGLADAITADGVWLRVVIEDRTGWLRAFRLDAIPEGLPVFDGTRFAPMQSLFLRTGLNGCGGESTALIHAPEGVTAL